MNEPSPSPSPSPFAPRPPEPSPEQRRFALLIHSIRREWVTYGIVAVNVLVFAVMVLSGVSLMAPTPQEALQWGASSGYYTIVGEFWRLYTANYVHFGIIHLGFNMYVLWRSGPLAERVFGHVGFAIGYAFAGLAGSVVSVFWNDWNVVSAGASGAVFGVFGMVGAFLVRRRSAMPRLLVTQLRNNVVSFIVLNVAFAFAVRGLDQAAHLGGLAGGFAAGLLMTPALTDEGPRRPWPLFAVPLVLMAAVTVAFASGVFGG